MVGMHASPNSHIYIQNIITLRINCPSVASQALVKWLKLEHETKRSKVQVPPFPYQ
uniref:Uncharacterized protein n=1 Tax=Rhizophora mucronata TaxID=61149 RepID=A0A2P2QL27_RHIMU